MPLSFLYFIIAGAILNKLDETANPCDDMVRFSCGKWLNETEIPGSRSRWGSFDTIASLIETVMRSKLLRFSNKVIFNVSGFIPLAVYLYYNNLYL